MNAEKLIALGRITKPQGLKGAFRVRAHGIESENLANLATIYIDDKSGALIKCAISSVQKRKGFFIIKTDSVTSIEQVQQLVDCEVLALREDLGELEDDEFYWFELVGLDVVTDKGRSLGKVDSIMPTGANDVLVVKKGRKEYLIPYIEEVVLETDLEKGVIEIRPMRGMLD